MTTRFEQRLFSGEANEAHEWEEYLAAFHRRQPGVTAAILNAMHGRDRRTSYEVLADALAPLPDAAAVLDVGCGNGYAFEAIHARYPGVRYTGLDLAADEIILARRTYPAATFVKARAQALPFASATFDAVTSHLALMLMDQVNVVLAECHRVLKPGGKLSIVVNDMATMTGDLLQLHRIAGQFANEFFRNIQALRMGDFAANAGANAGQTFARAGFVPNSFTITDFTVSGYRSEQDIRRYFRGLYIIGSIPERALDRLWQQLQPQFDALAGGTVRLDIPMRLMRAEKRL